MDSIGPKRPPATTSVIGRGSAPLAGGASPTGPARPAAPRVARRGRAAAVLLITLLLLLLGFTFASDLAGQVSANRWWMGAAGLLVCFALPVVIASWIRALRGRRSGGAVAVVPAGGLSPSASPALSSSPSRGPSSVTTIAFGNALLLALCALAAPSATQRALLQHGAWWVARIARAAGGDEHSPVVRAGHGAVHWLAELLPGHASGSEGPGAGSGGPGAGSGAATGSGLGTEQRPSSADGGLAGPLPLDAGAAAGPDQGVTPAGGEVRVAYEKRGNAIVVPVTLQGTAGSVAGKMLFDTGASLTTINEATLRALGQWVASADPTIQSHTANGVVERRITVIEGLALASARVGGGVTVSICEPCASGDVVGLLGLNVQRHFRVTLDHDAGRLVLAPKTTAVGHLQDISPFVELKDASGVWHGPLLHISLAVVNRSPRGLRNVRIAAVVKGEGKEGKEGRIWGEARAVPARDRTPLQLEGLSAVKGAMFQLHLEGAEW